MFFCLLRSGSSDPPHPVSGQATIPFALSVFRSGHLTAILPPCFLKHRRLEDLFEVKSGDYHSMNELDAGNTPLISCGDTSNGLIGYFEIPDEFIYERALTVAYNGSWPLMTKFHPYRFAAKDDVAVLLPFATDE